MKILGILFLIVGLFFLLYSNLTNIIIYELVGWPFIIVGLLLLTYKRKNIETIIFILLSFLILTNTIYTVIMINIYPYNQQFNPERQKLGVPIIEEIMYISEYPHLLNSPTTWKNSIDLLKESDMIHKYKMIVPKIHREYDRFIKRITSDSITCFDMNSYIKNDSVNYSGNLSKVSLQEYNYLLWDKLSYSFKGKIKNLSKTEVDSILKDWQIKKE